MEKKKNKGMIIGFLIGLLVAGIAIFILYYFKIVSFDVKNVFNKANDNKDIVEENNESQLQYDANDYVYTEKLSFGHEEFDVEKVNFKNIDKDLTKEFLEWQENCIKTAKDLNDNYGDDISYGKTYAKTNIWYEVNKNILTIYYQMESGASQTFEGCLNVRTLNIDLLKNKLLTNEEVIYLADGSFEKIAEEEYNRKLKFLEEYRESAFLSLDNKEIYYDEFKRNKNEYIELITNGLENSINAYIKNGKVEYEYMPLAIELTYQNIGKGGCFSHETAVVGNLK